MFCCISRPSVSLDCVIVEVRRAQKPQNLPERQTSSFPVHILSVCLAEGHYSFSVLLRFVGNKSTSFNIILFIQHLPQNFFISSFTYRLFPSLLPVEYSTSIKFAKLSLLCCTWSSISIQFNTYSLYLWLSMFITAFCNKLTTL